MKQPFKERGRAILRIALPAIVTNITTPLLSLVDIAIVGRLGAASYLGAIAVGSSLFNMVYWLLNFLRAGTSGLTAQALGSGQTSRLHTLFYRSLSIGAFFGVVLIALSPLLATIFIPFMDAEPATAQLAEEYFLIVIWGAPAYLAGYAITGWLLGNQNSADTLRIAVVTNVVNIALSVLFVFGFKMKLAGVALGTVCSQWIGTLYGLWIIRRKYRPRFNGWSDVLEKTDLKRFFSLNLDIFLRTVCLVAVTLWFTRAGSKMGTEILAANAILMQLFMLFSFFMDGFAYAGEAIAGLETGRGDLRKVRVLETDLLSWGVALALLGTVVYFFCGEWILRLLTDEMNIRETAKEYVHWAITIPLFGFMAFIYDGIYIGMALTRKMLLSMLMAVAVFFAFYFSLRTAMGNDALWLAFSLYLLTRGIAQLLLLRGALKTTSTG